MATTTLTPAPVPGRETPAPDHGADDLSHHAHRQLIGYLGLGLPFLLVIIAGVRPTDGLVSWEPLESVSAYYYTGAVAAFVGILVALALFLFTYRGYGNRYHRADRAAAIVGGFAALGVAFFPTDAPGGLTVPSWWSPTTQVLHYVSATVLFTVFIVFSIWLFRMTKVGEAMPRDKRRRNRIYLVCGLVMVGSVLWAASSVFTNAPILVPEAIALMAFAISWLVKGRAYRSVARTMSAVIRR